jgi:hypothetical protein
MTAAATRTLPFKAAVAKAPAFGDAPCRTLLYDLVAHHERYPAATEEGRAWLEISAQVLESPKKSATADEVMCLRSLRSAHTMIWRRLEREYLPPAPFDPPIRFREPDAQALWDRLDALIRTIDERAHNATEQAEKGRRRG